MQIQVVEIRARALGSLQRIPPSVCGNQAASFLCLPRRSSASMWPIVARTLRRTPTQLDVHRTSSPSYERLACRYSNLGLQMLLAVGASRTVSGGERKLATARNKSTYEDFCRHT